MRRSLPLTLGTLLLTGLLLAAPQTPKKEAPLRCTLTDKKIEKCCCETRGEKLYCPLAKKSIDKCCCEPAAGQKDKKS